MAGHLVASQKRKRMNSVSGILGITFCLVFLSGCPAKQDSKAKPRLEAIDEIKKLGWNATSSDKELKFLESKKEFGDSHLEELLKFLKDFETITTLKLNGSKVTSAGLVHLAKFPKIKSLDISDLDLKNDGLKNLKLLKDVLVGELKLRNNGIGDTGLVHLEGLSNLSYVSLAGNDDVTDDGIKKLEAAIPGLEVER